MSRDAWAALAIVVYGLGAMLWAECRVRRAMRRELAAMRDPGRPPCSP